MKKLFVIPLLAIVGVVFTAPSFDYQLSASDDVMVETVEIKHGDAGYDIEVGQEVELEQTEFTFLPTNATNKSIKYKLFDDSYDGDLPPAMFSSTSSYDNILIKGLMVGDLKVYFYAADGNGAYSSTTFHVHPAGQLPSGSQQNGITEIKTFIDNGVTEGTTSLYEVKSHESVEHPTPIYKDGAFNFSAIPTFISQFFTIDAFVILGIVLIGLLFLYILLYSIKKAIWKLRR